VLFDLPDVKPGDSGRSRFCFEIETNPAYLWVCGSLQRNAEAGLTEQERKSESSAEYETGELADAIRVKLKYADAAGNASETITKGSLRTVLARLSEGYHSILRGVEISQQGLNRYSNLARTTSHSLNRVWYSSGRSEIGW